MTSTSRLGFLVRPKWLGFHLLCLAAVAAMLLAGFWQLRRLDDRKAANESFVAQIEQAPVPLAELVPTGAAANPDDVQASVNRRITATGTYLPDQIVLFNRSQGGRAVDNVLTPLALDDGRILVVNRGAIAVESTPPAPPAGTVTIEGRLRPSEVRQRGELSDAEVEVIEQTRRVDLRSLDAQLGGDVVPLYVELLAAEPAIGPDDPVLLGPPELSEGNHLSYAFQWFIFSFCVVVGWVLAVRRSLRTRAVSSGE